MKERVLPVFGIRVNTSIADSEPSGDIICSPDLYEVCPKCNCRGCLYSCDGSSCSDGIAIGDVESEATVAARHQYNGAIDGIMGMILAHACAGIDIETPAYLEGIETAINGAAENL